MKMTDEDYFKRHIPHRVNLLITFRDRFAKVQLKEKGYYIRDLFRCSKDSSLLMIRFFTSELGVKLKMGTTNELVENKDIAYIERVNSFGLLKLSIDNDLKSNPILFNEITEALKAGNRAVAHIIDEDVDHIFKDDQGDEIIFRLTTFLEEKIISNIYKSKEKFENAMDIPDNNMHRERLVIYR